MSLGPDFDAGLHLEDASGAALPQTPTILFASMSQNQTGRREELGDDAPPLERYFAAAKEKVQKVYDRIYYGDVVPPVGAYRISYARCAVMRGGGGVQALPGCMVLGRTAHEL